MTNEIDTTYTIGTEAAFDSIAPNGSFGVLFEDDGNTAYFHAIDVEGGQQLLDTLHVYDADRMPGREAPCRLRIMWSRNGMAAALVLNEACYALFDFASRAGYSHSGGPEPASAWARVRQRQLTADIVRMFF